MEENKLGWLEDDLMFIDKIEKDKLVSKAMILAIGFSFSIYTFFLFNNREIAEGKKMYDKLEIEMKRTASIVEEQTIYANIMDKEIEKHGSNYYVVD